MSGMTLIRGIKVSCGPPAPVSVAIPLPVAVTPIDNVSNQVQLRVWCLCVWNGMIRTRDSSWESREIGMGMVTQRRVETKPEAGCIKWSYRN